MRSRAYVAAYNRLRRAMKKAYRELRRKGGYRAVGERFGVSGGLVHMIVVDGYMPADARTCKTLGLPYRVWVEVDPRTGHIHLPEEVRAIKAAARRRRSLEEMGTEELLWALTHREEMR